MAGEVDRKKAARAPSRNGKKAVSVWLCPEFAKALKIAAAVHGTAQEVIVAEGIALMLEGKYRV